MHRAPAFSLTLCYTTPPILNNQTIPCTALYLIQGHSAVRQKKVCWLWSQTTEPTCLYWAVLFICSYGCWCVVWTLVLYFVAIDNDLISPWRWMKFWTLYLLANVIEIDKKHPLQLFCLMIQYVSVFFIKGKRSGVRLLKTVRTGLRILTSRMWALKSVFWAEKHCSNCQAIVYTEIPPKKEKNRYLLNILMI